MEIDPDMLLRDLVEKALAKARVKYSPEDMIVVCNNELLDQNKTIDKQTYKSPYGQNSEVQIINSGLEIGIIHKSKRGLLVQRRNPYDGSIRSFF